MTKLVDELIEYLKVMIRPDNNTTDWGPWKAQELLQKLQNPKYTNQETHHLYKTSDPDAPANIKDRNGEVVLGLCVLCGAGEIELEEMTCADRLFRQVLKLKSLPKR